MRRACAIAGAGGFGRELVTYVQDAQEDGWDYELVGFLDDGRPNGEEVLPGLSIVGTTQAPPQGVEILIALGDPRDRRGVARRVAAAGNSLATFVHPTAYVARNALVGAGSLICPFALVGSSASVGVNAVVNIYAAVGHDGHVGDHSVLSPYSSLMGAAHIERCVFLGGYASVAPQVVVGAFSKLTAGAFLYSDAPAGSLMAGNPAAGRIMFSTQE